MMSALLIRLGAFKTHLGLVLIPFPLEVGGGQSLHEISEKKHLRSNWINKVCRCDWYQSKNNFLNSHDNFGGVDPSILRAELLKSRK